MKRITCGKLWGNVKRAYRVRTPPFRITWLTRVVLRIFGARLPTHGKRRAAGAAVSYRSKHQMAGYTYDWIG